MSRRAVFRADASVAIGGGHVRRCLVLAEALRAARWQCVFACRPDTRRAVPALAGAGHRVVEIAGPDTESPARIAAEIGKCDLLVVDHYGLDAAFERACRDWADRILVLDDCADRDHDADLLLDPTLGRLEADYGKRVPDACRLLLGPAYALLRSGFAELRPGVLAARRFDGPVGRILVTLGTADPDNVTAVVLEGLAKAGTGAAVDVVLGGAAPHLRKIKALASSLPIEVDVHTEVEDMAAMMASADFAIGAAGSTVWERCCLGLPGLVTVIADNQRLIAASLDAAGGAHNLGPHGELTAAKVVAAFRDLDGDPAARAAMSARAATICDGLGAGRVLAETTT